MKFIYNLAIIFFVVVMYQQPLKAQTYFLDFKLLLNESDAGKKANKLLNDELNQGIKNWKILKKSCKKKKKI